MGQKNRQLIVSGLFIFLPALSFCQFKMLMAHMFALDIVCPHICSPKVYGQPTDDRPTDQCRGSAGLSLSVGLPCIRGLRFLEFITPGSFSCVARTVFQLDKLVSELESVASNWGVLELARSTWCGSSRSKRALARTFQHRSHLGACAVLVSQQRRRPSKRLGFIERSA